MNCGRNRGQGAEHQPPPGGPGPLLIQRPHRHAIPGRGGKVREGVVRLKDLLVEDALLLCIQTVHEDFKMTVRVENPRASLIRVLAILRRRKGGTRRGSPEIVMPLDEREGFAQIEHLHGYRLERGEAYGKGKLPPITHLR
ncbi:unnamed protein product [Phytomonas sp. Hart1]|nr:unnamed protein product [Phytomonas sp. Hart1]|eukprot:CCW70749.1 unnamed protein product [Phytomonas sp. isolate Hart1]